jgi:hypothetical protein
MVGEASRTDGIKWSAPTVTLARRLYERSEAMNPRGDDFVEWDELKDQDRDFWCFLINDLLNDETTILAALKSDRTGASS